MNSIPENTIKEVRSLLEALPAQSLEQDSWAEVARLLRQLELALRQNDPAEFAATKNCLRLILRGQRKLRVEVVWTLASKEVRELANQIVHSLTALTSAAPKKTDNADR